MNTCRRLALGLALAALVASLGASPAQAAVEWKKLKELDLKTHPVDAVAAQDGKRVFILAPGEVLLYSPQDNAVVERLPVDKEYDRIARLEPEDSVVLISSKSGKLGVYTLDLQFKVLTTGLPFHGPANAPVTLAVVSDYQCPSCAQLDPIVSDLLNKYSNKLKVVYKSYPIAGHQFAKDAALAALAAWKQNKFDEFHKRLFENQSQLDENFLLNTAKELGLDVERFNRDRNGPELRDLLEKDIANAKEIGVQGTPSLYINGRPLKNRSLQGLHQLIDEELAKGK